MLGALTPGVILTLILAALSVAAALFMLTFLNAMVRELRGNRARGVEQRQKNTVVLVTPKRYPRQDRAA